MNKTLNIWNLVLLIYLLTAKQAQIKVVQYANLIKIFYKYFYKISEN
jgi:hypothetical protein